MGQFRSPSRSMVPTRPHGGLPQVAGLRVLYPARSIRSALSVRSTLSVASVRSTLSVGSIASMLSLGSAGSILSIGSAGSILSIGSAGSILSIGSAGSILSIGSAGSILSIGSAGSIGGHGAGAQDRRDHAEAASAIGPPPRSRPGLALLVLSLLSGARSWLAPHPRPAASTTEQR